MFFTAVMLHKLKKSGIDRLAQRALQRARAIFNQSLGAITVCIQRVF